MQLHRFDEASAFLDRAGPFLVAREAEHNLIFGICSMIQANPALFAQDPPQFAMVTDHGAVIAAIMRTPPFQLILSQIDDLAAVEILVDGLSGPIPGVLGPRDAAARFAELWTQRSGQPAGLGLRERIFRLTRVIPQRPAEGSWRLAEGRDRGLLMDWIDAFRREAVPDDPAPPDLGALADRWIARSGRLAYLWEDGGRVVSWVGASGETPHGIRIAPVYTPPELRARGYASNLTAAASQDQLDRGRQLCFLFTDLANPTSNKIYRAIGYQPIVDVDQYRFG